MSKYLEFDTPATRQAKDLKADFGLKHHGLLHLDRGIDHVEKAIEEAGATVEVK